MGDFGMRLAREIKNRNNEVYVVDENEETINMLNEEFENAICGNATHLQVVNELGVEKFDYCIVTVGNNFYESLQITSNLKEAGAKYIIAKSYSDFQDKFLRFAGADETIYPEKEFAMNYATKLSSSSLISYFDLSSDFDIAEMSVPKDWINKSIFELNIRQKYGLNIVAIKRDGKIVDDFSVPFTENDTFYVAGNPEKITKLSK